MALKAVLFDFDGVLADTENHHIAAWQRTLAALGWQITDEVAARSAEVDDEVFAAELFAERGIASAAVDDWVRKKQRLTVQLMTRRREFTRGPSSSSERSKAACGSRSSPTRGART